MKIKICGIRRMIDAEYLNFYLPDYAGFIFAPTRRQVSLSDAAKLRNKLESRIKTVGVFVNEDIELVQKTAREGIIDIIQLHGDEDDEYIKKLGKSVPVIKAQRVSSRSDIKDYDTDMYLFDTYVKGIYGGTGKSFDWDILDNIKKPYFLAGGIDINNIDAALKTNAFALDISGGVETDGFKDEKKIKEIIEKVRDN